MIYTAVVTHFLDCMLAQLPINDSHVKNGQNDAFHKQK